MNAYKNAHVNTIDAVVLFLQQKKEDIIPFAPAIANDLLALTDKRAAITLSLANADVTTKAVTERKQATRNMVVTTGKKFASAAIAHASSKNDALLVNEYKALRAKLSEAKDADLPVVAGNLYKKLQDIAPNMIERGVTTTDLDNFSAAITQFQADAPTVKNVRNASSSENAEAEKLIAEARDIIVLQIGGTLATIEAKIPTLYAIFLKTAKLQKAAVASTELTFVALHGVTNVPLEGASAQLVNESSKQVATKTVKRTTPQSAKQKSKAVAKEMQMRTSTMGEVILKKNIAKGQVWEITREGYETAFVTLPKLTRGKSHMIEVHLVPIAA